MTKQGTKRGRQAAGLDVQGLVERCKRLNHGPLAELLENALRGGLIDPAKLEPLLVEQEAADAAAQEAVADAAQVAALERLTDPALIDGWCGSMADDLSELIESDWHDGWEEQSEQFGGVMHEVQFMLATAGVAHFSGRHGLALRACAALGKGLSKICKAYRSSRNDIKEELCGPACEDLGFPMDPPSGLPQMLPAAVVEKSQVAKHMKALRKLWDALPADRFLDAGGKADLWVDCSCLQDVLTVTWLAAWSGMVTAGDQAAAAARLAKLLHWVDTQKQWVGKRASISHVLRLAENLGLKKKPQLWAAVTAAVQ